VLQNRNDGIGTINSRTLLFGTQAKARLWRQALESVLLRLNRAGVPVLLVHSIPVLPLESSGCAVALVLAGKCSGEVSRSAVDRSLRFPIQVENEAIAVAPATWAVSFENEICGKTSCSTMRDGVVQYRDSSHLSVDGALMLTDAFYREIILHAIPRRSQ
jgi:hypothetical protein